VKLLPGIGNKGADNLWRAWEESLDANGEITSWGERLLKMPVSAKSKKSWQQLAFTLDEIAPGGKPNPPSEMITSIVQAIYDDYAKANFTNYELRKEDLNQLAAFARQFGSVDEFLSQLALISNVDAEAAPNPNNDNEAVNLSSVHQAKGLEYHTVFVIWLTDGMFPSSRSLETQAALEEERRLFYVAVTRARDELYLTYPQMRLNAGYGDMWQRPSRFLKEIPTELVEDWQIRHG
jgi:DNA helicase II / ATP-dependent DNA helicase PcrA